MGRHVMPQQPAPRPRFRDWLIRTADSRGICGAVRLAAGLAAATCAHPRLPPMPQRGDRRSAGGHCGGAAASNGGGGG